MTQGDLGERLRGESADGRLLAGASRLGGRTLFSPGFSDWRTGKQDAEAFAEVAAELGRNPP